MSSSSFGLFLLCFFVCLSISCFAFLVFQSVGKFFFPPVLHAVFLVTLSFSW